ncbi:MAG: VRR-NUC domain-containing protein, partial [Halioglobus sp.]
LGRLDVLLDTLLEQGMAVPAANLSSYELGKLYTRAELQHSFATHFPGTKFRDKSALLDAIDALSEREQDWSGLVDGVITERVVAPWGAEQVQVLQLMFFGNRHQSLTEFVLSDLGVARYYPYRLDRQSRLFRQRKALQEYLECSTLRDTWYELRDQGDSQGMRALAADVLCKNIVYPSSEQRWYRLCNALARDMERMGEMNTALALYSKSQRHPARERRARVLEKTGDWSGAVAVCEEILASPWGEEEKEAASRILPRVRRKLGGTQSRQRRDAFQHAYLQLLPGTGAVELQAAAHLSQHWQSVHYVENKLMNTLFGLAFWEQIFAAVPGAFHNPYQSVPTDMYEPAFRTRRRDSLESRLAQLRDADLSQFLSRAYTQYNSLQCRWVDWRRIDLELVRAALRVIPRAHMLAIWERMLFDPGENRRGFPDLIAIGEEVGDYYLIEIKAPGDALQDSQKRWLRFFQQQDIPAQVAWVEWDASAL